MIAPSNNSGLHIVALLCAAEVLGMTGFSTYPALLAPLPELKPGAAHTATARFVETGIRRVVVEIVRPTGSTVLHEVWRTDAA